MTFFAAHAETRERALWAAVHELAVHSTVEVRRLLEQEAKTNASAAEKTRELLGSLIQESTGI